MTAFFVYVPFLVLLMGVQCNALGFDPADAPYRELLPDLPPYFSHFLFENSVNLSYSRFRHSSGAGKNNIGISSHGVYHFDDSLMDQTYVKLKNNLEWHKDHKGYVYAAEQFWFVCGQGGYMGAQHQGDLAPKLLNFAIWDFNDTVMSSAGVSPWCSRFGGEGAGSHCQINYTMVHDRDYEFQVVPTGANATGAFWSGYITDLQENTTTLIGELFLGNTWDNKGNPINGYGLIVPAAASFQEYFLGGSFYSGFEWNGPAIEITNGSLYYPFQAVADADLHHSVTSPNGPHQVFFQAGENVETSPAVNTTQPLW